MPAVTRSDDDVQKPHGGASTAFRVLLTGFGPFHTYDENPSWLAVKPLQNAILQTDVHPDAFLSKTAATGTNTGTGTGTGTSTSGAAPSTFTVEDPVLEAQHRPIHITTLQIPVVYESVLRIVPGLHAHPPVLPPDAPSDCAQPPDTNYDFVFHVGVAGRGPLRMERVGHKLGYHMKDATGVLAPAVKVITNKDFSRRGGDSTGAGPGPGVGAVGSIGGSAGGVSAAENIERERVGAENVEAQAVTVGGDAVARPNRGFGISYETFPEEITTEIDVTKLVQDLKNSGVEQIYSSMDAGHYLCDFIYYCSLAEAKRSATKPYEKRRNTQVLFLHCPPVNQPLSTEEVTDAIKRIIVWVCGEQQVRNAKSDAGAVAGVTG